MMPVWQMVAADLGAARPGSYKAQCVRKDGHRADLHAATNGDWAVYDLCDTSKPMASGRAASLDHAQLLARLVWELSA